MSQVIDSSAIRMAILDSIPRDVFAAGEPDPRFLYLPDSHVRALDPDSMLVVGARGAGKSFWWNALQNPSTRRIVSHLFPSRAHEKLDVVGGWGTGSLPGKDVLVTLLSTDARIVWKTIVLERLDPAFFEGGVSWKDRVALVQRDPERVEQRLVAIDNELLNARTRKIVLFDALDLVADTWPDRKILLKGLFKLLLDFRYTRSIRLKAFVRADAVEDAEIRAFPDASKLLHARVELTWTRIDLYGLFWQHLGNARKGGKEVRSLLRVWAGDDERWDLPVKLAKDEDVQRDLFIKLAGEKMGGSIKRGRPYLWIPNHLADARGQTTPRSFLAALRAAAEQTDDDHGLALDWRAIQKGIEKASEIRVDEIKEDFAWMEVVMKPLRNLTVPCEQKEVLDRWKRAEVLKAIKANSDGTKPLPPRFDEGLPGLLRDLEQLGVLYERSESRINLPDLYRVKFGLRRRGGVPPAR
jgi:hypothetical protein